MFVGAELQIVVRQGVKSYTLGCHIGPLETAAWPAPEIQDALRVVVFSLQIEDIGEQFLVAQISKVAVLFEEPLPKLQFRPVLPCAWKQERIAAPHRWFDGLGYSFD